MSIRTLKIFRIIATVAFMGSALGLLSGTTVTGYNSYSCSLSHSRSQQTLGLPTSSSPESPAGGDIAPARTDTEKGRTDAWREVLSPAYVRKSV